MASRRSFLAVNLALPAGGLATSRCEDCGQCAVACPNGVAVRQRLIAAQRMFA